MTTVNKSPFIQVWALMEQSMEQNALKTAGMSRQQMIEHYAAAGGDRVELELTVDELIEERDERLAEIAARGGAPADYERFSKMSQEELERAAKAEGLDLEKNEQFLREALNKALADERAAGTAGDSRSVDELSTVEQMKLLARLSARQEEREWDDIEAVSREQREAELRAAGVDVEENRRVVREMLEKDDAGRRGGDETGDDSAS
jgi:hypothetical protein